MVIKDFINLKMLCFLATFLLVSSIFSGCSSSDPNDIDSDQDTLTDIDADEVDKDVSDNTVQDENITGDTEPDEDSNDFDEVGDTDPCVGFIEEDCDTSFSECTGFNVVKKCAVTECGKAIVEETCPDTFGCFNGKCVSGQCADECVPGNEEDGKTCQFWDNKNLEWTETDQTNRLYDRYEEFQRWQHSDLMPFGGVADAHYATEEHKEIVSYDGVGDSAIWTGTYLAAESIRYMVDGSVAARQNVIDLVNTLHLFFNVAGSPGLLSRYAYESKYRDQPEGQVLGGDTNCESDRVFCDILYDGKNYDYTGDISRDQYQGILMGYSFAYDALGEEYEDIRKIIREDTVEFVQVIMSKQQIYLTLTYDGTPIPLPSQIDARFIVTAPREMTNNRVVVNYCSTETSDCKTSMHGFQEFMPNIATLLRQADGLSWIPKVIPRSGSAIMLANIFNIGIQVTEGIEEYNELNQELKDFYYTNDDDWGNVNDWLDQAEQWFYSNECGDSYYGINIAMEPMYNLLRLEKDMDIRGRIYFNVLQAKMWEKVKTHKNSFFTYIYSSQGGFSSEITGDATEQFRGFTTAPHIYKPVDLLDDPKYQDREDGCTNQVNNDTSAVDVADRKAADFMWQRNPFDLYSGGDPKKIFSGVDYMIVYWMGRLYGYIEDDSENRCFRWKEN